MAAILNPVNSSPSPLSDTDAFYQRLFTRDPHWSMAYPNVEEARRAARLLPLLSEVAREHAAQARGALRILDLGCGRGWLTYIASAYGDCLGIDPVQPVIEYARTRFPQLRFETGTARDLLARGHHGQFDLVIASEVIEHVPAAGKEEFVQAVASLLVRGGAAIVTSDRGELYARWVSADATAQPEEDWLTERELRELFCRNGYRVVRHDRAYYGHRRLSLFHRAVGSARVQRLLNRMRQHWLLEGMRYLAAECQVWLFRTAP